MTDVVAHTPLGDQMAYAKALAASDLLPQAYRGKPANVLIALALGEALGLAPTTALYGIAVISGKPTLNAETMRAVVLSKGHRFDVTEFEADRATVTCARRERPNDVSTFTFTIEDAKRAGLVSATYDKFPKAMLLARASSQACRAIFPDCLAGVSYTPDELEPTPAERIEAVSRDLWTTPEEIVEAEVIPVADIFVPGGQDGRIQRQPATEPQRKMLGRLSRECGFENTAELLASDDAVQILGGRPSDPLNKAHASALIDALMTYKAEAALGEVTE